jgi:hypothetical protein
LLNLREGFKKSSFLDLPKEQLKEECPSCGSLLAETLQNRRLSSSMPQQMSVTNVIQKPAGGLSSHFQTAYRQVG